MKIGNYEILGEIFSFRGNVKASEGRKDDGSRVLLLQFPQEKNNQKIFSTAGKVAMDLGSERQMFLPIIEVFTNTNPDGDSMFCVAYEWDDLLTPLRDVDPDRGGLWIMHAAAQILKSVEKRRLSGEFLGEQAIFVDEENYTVCLAFIGLAKAFDECGAGPWPKDASRSYRDDVFYLAKCFENEIQEAKNMPEIVCNCLAGNADGRPRYPNLLREMKSPLFHPLYEKEVFLVLKDGDLDELIEHLNSTHCYLSPWEEDKKGKDRRSCKFFTGKYEGTFINSKDDMHFFVPRYYPSSRRPQGNILLRARFCQKPKSRPVKGEGYHHLAEIGNQKTETLAKWRLVPEKEKEYIEDNKFSAKYLYKRRIAEHPIKKYSFLLSCMPERHGIEDLKARQRQLDIVPVNVRHSENSRDELSAGVIDDIKNRLIFKIRTEKGASDPGTKEKLIIGGKQGKKYPCELYARKGDLLSFMADMDVSDLSKEEIEDLRGESVHLESGAALFGSLEESTILPEIITRDSDTEYSKLPKEGNLSEDISMEVVPFIRQMEAIDAYERGDIADKSLLGILTTPEEYDPPVVKPMDDGDGYWVTSDIEGGQTEPGGDAESEQGGPGSIWVGTGGAQFFNNKLNKSQKEAVWYALQHKLFFIQGPPGTGKTTVIVEMIRQILAKSRNARILICSQTNLAVDNVLERLPDNKREDKHAPIRKVRLASKDTGITPAVKGYWIDKRVKAWAKDVINRSKVAQENAGKMRDTGHEGKIIKVIKKWRSFLGDTKSKNCQIRGNVEGGWLPLETAYLRSMNVLGATCVHIASSRNREIFGNTFDYHIIDEAGKATPGETMIPVVLAKHNVLIGDHKQLPPFVTREEEVWNKVRDELEDEGIEDPRQQFGESLFEKLISAKSMASCQKMLDTQRRMPKQIGDMISKYFYGGELISPEDEEYKLSKKFDLPLKGATSLVFVDTSGKEERHDNGQKKRRENHCNADVVIDTLCCLDRRLKEAGISPKIDIAVIAGYKGQVELLKKRVKREKFRGITVDVNTIDGFQGRENTVVIYDIVRSSSRKRDYIGFLDDPRRLNVALSRAQKLLIIVGDADYLINRALPMPDINPNPEAVRPILGEIAKEIQDQNNVFESLEEALE